MRNPESNAIVVDYGTGGHRYELAVNQLIPDFILIRQIPIHTERSFPLIK
jgi:hypothetical protein